ncbi:MAG: iron-containing alcohol dehydrogenase, partial [Gemmatimonadota bacterium]|nr:iron-containing alcohol dehydrogenase [Gemmatimonadota bacterium]
MTSFTLDLPHTHIVFGVGSLRLLGRELERLGAQRVMVISTPGRAVLAASLDGLIPSLIVHRFESAVPHVPEGVFEEARAAAAASAADCLLSLGGGSAIGIAKAVGLRAGIPVAAVPTTYSGSEMTPIWGLTTSGEKQTGRDPRVQPRLVVYD